MQKRSILASLCLACCLFILSHCSKNDDDDPGTNKTELLTKSSWKFQKAEAGGVGDVSSQIDQCIKDNIVTFVSTTANAGTGTLDEGATRCDSGDQQIIPFTWTLESNETILKSSVPFFPGGSGQFTVVSLTATNLVVSQQMTIAPYPTTTVTLTLQH